MGFETKKMGELVKSVSDTFNFKGVNEVIFLNTSDTENGVVMNHKKMRVSELPGQAKKRIKKGDFLFSEIRPINRRFAIVDFDAENYVVSTKLMVLRCSELIDKKYFFYFLTNPDTLGHLQMLAESRSGTFPQITFDHISNLEINLPPLSTQRRIAALLTALDDKIELNRRMNETLEGIAQGVWGEWFGGVVGGETILLDDLIEFNPRIQILTRNEVSYVEMKDLPQNGMSISGFIKRLFTSGSKFQQHDTLLARITPCLENGKTAFVDFLEKDEKAFGSTEFITMRPKQKISPYFVYFVARDEAFRAFAISSMVGSSGRQRIQTNMLPNFEFVKPDKFKMESFHKMAKPIFEMIHQNSKQSRTLTELRDLLLPRLMSGELEV
jgi:type I restriction enzyme, S subunit